MTPTRIRARRLAMVVGVSLIAGAIIPLAGAARPLSVGGPTATTGPYDNGTVLPNGRLVTPAGRVSDLGDFPLGVAVSPDGRLVVAINSGAGDGTGGGTGNYCAPRQQGDCPQPSPTPAPGAASYRQPDESLSVTDLRTGRVSTVTAIPTIPDGRHFNFFNEGVAFSPDGRHLYASGGGNDALYDFPVRHDVVASRPIRTVILPDHVSAQPSLPALGSGNAYTKGLAVTPDGRYVLVAHEFENALEIVDTRTYADSQVMLGQPSALGGPYPYGVAVSPHVTVANGAPTYMAYVTEQGMGMVAQVMIGGDAGTMVGTTAVGDHPTGVAVSPDGSELYVTNADDDTLSILTLDAASGTPAAGATIPLHAFPGEQLGSTPNAVAVSPDGQRVYVALAGDDAVAVLGTARSFSSTAVGAGRRGASPAAGSFVVGGMIPAGWYPSGVTISPDGRQVYIVSAKGLGSRFPGTALGGALVDSYYQIKTSMPGILQVVPAPTSAALLSGLATVQQDILHATDTDTRSPRNPIPAVPISITSPLSLTTTPATPIKYVIEIVKENRTFDQILGDLPGHEGRNQMGTDTVNVEPAYATFGRAVTPNAHALLGDPISATVPATAYTAFATSDNFYSDGEASVQGHYWTAAANVNDYVEKSWLDYYSNRNHVQDTVSPASTPHNCTIFQSALLRQTANPGPINGFTFRDYGELVGATAASLSGGSTGGGPTAPQNACGALPDANFSLAASSQLTLVTDDRNTARGFLGDVGLNTDGTTSISGTLAPSQYYLRNFSYVIMGADHTSGLSGANSPRARVAQNDAGLGILVAALSRSKYWPQTAIFVMEDDSQDGLDHVDGHRNLLYVLSPYAKHVGLDGRPGYVSHLHYSQAGVLKTINLILGLPYLSTYDQNATALYDLFQNKDDPAQLTARDLAPYTLQPEPGFIDETPAQVTAAMGAAADVPLAESRGLNLTGIDRAGPMLEIVNWQLAHPTWPIPAQLQGEEQAWLARHGGRDRD